MWSVIIAVKEVSYLLWRKDEIMKKVLLFVLLTSLLLFVCSCAITGWMPYTYENPDAYTAGAHEYATEGIRTLYIDWMMGEVDVRYHDKETIALSEESDTPIPDAKEVRSAVIGDTLFIRFAESGENSTNFDTKELTVLLPRAFSLAKLEVCSISSKVKVADLVADALEVSNISGETLLTSVAVKEQIDIESVSGKIELSTIGKTDTVEIETVSGHTTIAIDETKTLIAETVSGSFSATMTKAPQTLDVESTSGLVILDFPDDVSATIDLDMTSGNFSCSLPHTGPSGNIVVIGTGTYRYEIDATSASVHIE